jgi:hypothetical protein
MPKGFVGDTGFKWYTIELWQKGRMLYGKINGHFDNKVMVAFR